jgi:hypothetical protein
MHQVKIEFPTISHIPKKVNKDLPVSFMIPKMPQHKGLYSVPDYESGQYSLITPLVNQKFHEDIETN